MATEHNDHKAAYDDINVRSVALVGGVGAVLVFVAVVAVQVIYYRYAQDEYVQKVENVPTTEINQTLAEQRERLSVAGPGADPEKGEKSIPIQQAMKSVLAEYREKQAVDNDAGESAKKDATVEGDEATESTSAE